MRISIKELFIACKFLWVLSVSIFFIPIPTPGFAETQWNVGVTGGNQGIEGFNLSIGEYYKVPEREVVVVHERGIPEDELPVVFHVAQHARVRPEVIVNMRLRHMSWMDITYHYGLSPEIYYVPVYHGPPYGKAYGYYKKHPSRKEWKKIHLRDEDVINQVNLKLMSEHHGYAPDRVMIYREKGQRFSVIDHDIRYEKYGNGKKKDRKEDKHKGKNAGGKDQKKQGKDKGKK